MNVVNVQKFPGKRKNSTSYFYVGRFYCMDNRSKIELGFIIRCKYKNSKGCEASIRLAPGTELQVEDPQKVINHTCNVKPIDDFPRIYELKKALYEEAAGGVDDLETIFKRITAEDGE